MATVKQDKAIAHITEQMMSNAKDGKPAPHIQAIEEMLTDICTTDAVAEKLLAEGKNIQGAFLAMEGFARKNQQDNRCCVPPWQAMKIIEDYYGITEEDKSSRKKHKKQSAPIDVLSQI